MAVYTYRGHQYDSDAKAQEAANQRVWRRPEMVYRGVKHNGVKPTGAPSKPLSALLEEPRFYRGVRLA